MIGAGEEDGEPEAGGDAAAEGDLAAQHLGLQHHRRGSYKQVPTWWLSNYKEWVVLAAF